MARHHQDAVFQKYDVTQRRWEEVQDEMVNEATIVLYGQLLFLRIGQNVDVDLNLISDDPSNTEMGFYFCSHKANNDRNSHLSQLRQVIDIKHNYQSRPEVKRSTLSDYQRPSCHVYERSMETFLEYLFLATLLRGGKPDEGIEVFASGERPACSSAELSAPVYYNEIGGAMRKRSLDVHEGRMRCIINFNQYLLLERKHDRRVSELIFWYLAFVLPFFKRLNPRSVYAILSTLYAGFPGPDGGVWTVERLAKITDVRLCGRLGGKLNEGGQVRLVQVNEFIKELATALRQDIAEDMAAHIGRPADSAEVEIEAEKYRLRILEDASRDKDHPFLKPIAPLELDESV